MKEPDRVLIAALDEMMAETNCNYTEVIQAIAASRDFQEQLDRARVIRAWYIKDLLEHLASILEKEGI